MGRKITLERVGRPGFVRVDERMAPLLLKKGRYRRVEITPRSAADDDRSTYVIATDRQGQRSAGAEYAEMDYRELQRLVREREVEADGRSKDDLVAALEKADRYNRRDMRAED